MKSLKYALKNEWYNLLMLILPFIAIPFLWTHMPEKVPTHWNLQGQVDDYGSKTFGLLFLPAINVVIYFVNLYLPQIDPKKRFSIAQKPLPIIRTLLVVFLLCVHIWMIVLALGYHTGSTSWIYLGINALFLILGNYMRTLKPNYFIGIRVPWALEDEDNWRATHRVASYLWVAGSVFLFLLFPFLGLQTYSNVFGATVMALAFIPMGYSFYYYKFK